MDLIFFFLNQFIYTELKLHVCWSAFRLADAVVYSWRCQRCQMLLLLWCNGSLPGNDPHWEHSTFEMEVLDEYRLSLPPVLVLFCCVNVNFGFKWLSRSSTLPLKLVDIGFLTSSSLFRRFGCSNTFSMLANGASNSKCKQRAPKIQTTVFINPIDICRQIQCVNCD